MADAVLKLENLNVPTLYKINQNVDSVQQNTDLFDLFGWSDLPFELKSVVASDLAGYRDEMLGLYSTRDPHVLNRRKSVAYWIKMYRNKQCSLSTAFEALKPSC